MAAHYIVVKHFPLMQYISEYLGLAPSALFPLFSFSLLPFSFSLIPLCASSFYYIILRTKSTERLVHVRPCSLYVSLSPSTFPLPPSLYSIIIPNTHTHTNKYTYAEQISYYSCTDAHQNAHTHAQTPGTITQADPNSCLVSHKLI